jgi:hypothetical protein
MILKKTSLALLVLAAVLAFSPPIALQAATLLGPGTRVQTDNMIEQIRDSMTPPPADDGEDDDVVPDDPSAAPATKAPTKKAAVPDDPNGTPAKKTAAKKTSAKAGSCATYMYWDSKAKTCADARNKR